MFPFWCSSVYRDSRYYNAMITLTDNNFSYKMTILEIDKNAAKEVMKRENMSSQYRCQWQIRDSRLVLRFFEKQINYNIFYELITV